MDIVHRLSESEVRQAVAEYLRRRFAVGKEAAPFVSDKDVEIFPIVINKKTGKVVPPDQYDYDIVVRWRKEDESIARKREQGFDDGVQPQGYDGVGVPDSVGEGTGQPGTVPGNRRE